jgi:hypothetical protein
LAETNEKRALAYADRSIIFFDLKKYKECLQNIQWARENGYPANKIKKLNKREEKCRKLMAEEVKDPADDPKEFFKLSYPANPKIPFIVDCLEMRIVNNEARLYTTRDLKAGDIIFEQEIMFPKIYKRTCFYRCCHCAKGNSMNLIPCLKTGKSLKLVKCLILNNFIF